MSSRLLYRPDKLREPPLTKRPAGGPVDQPPESGEPSAGALAELLDEYTTHSRAALVHREKAQIALRGILEHLSGGEASAEAILHAVHSVRLM